MRLTMPKSKKFWSPALITNVGGIVAGSGLPVLTFVSQPNLAQSGSVASSSTVNIGTASGFTTRRIIIAGGSALGYSGAVLAAGSSTINGVAVTKHVETSNSAGVYCVIVSADVPTGSTNVTVSFQYGGSIFAQLTCAVYSVDDALLQSTIPSTGSAQTASSVTSLATSAFTETTGGFVAAVAALATSPTGLAITGYNTDALGGGSRNINSSLTSGLTTGSATATATWTTSSTATIAAAGWR